MGIPLRALTMGFVVLTLLSGCSDFKDVFHGGSGQKVRKSKDPKEGREPIRTKEGTYYFVHKGDTLSQISERYKISPIAIAQINNLFDSGAIYVGQRLFLPHRKTLKKYVDPKEIKAAEKKSKQKSKLSKRRTPQFIWPIPNARVSSVYGPRRGKHHDGIDLAVPVGTQILAVAGGKVLYAARFTTYGNLVVIKHRNGYSSAYAHLKRMYVKKGQTVKQGQKIGTVGMTGKTSGPHLHFEIQKNIDPIDPMPLLPPRK